jgi:hypothetical protein
MLCCFMVSDSSEEHVLAGAKRNRLTSALLYWGGLPGAPVTPKSCPDIFSVQSIDSSV